MNRIFLLGNLTRDPELSETNAGKKVCRFSIAVNRDYTDSNGERGTDFFNVVAYGSKAETIGQYFKKGRKISLEGAVKTGTYETSDGQKRKSFDVMLRDFWFTSSNGGGHREDDEAEADYYGGGSRNNSKSDNQSSTGFDEDSDIPF